MSDVRRRTARIGLAGGATLIFLMMLLARSPQAFTADRLPPSDEGEVIFKSRCSICHGAEGGGDTATGKKLKIPDLRSAEVQARTDEQLTAVISDGKGAMPPFGEKMDSGKIKLVVAYVRELGRKKNED